MAEVLIAQEWIAVAEPMQDVLEAIEVALGSSPVRPLEDWVSLTAESIYATGAPRKPMRVAAAAIQAVRESAAAG